MKDLYNTDVSTTNWDTCQQWSHWLWFVIIEEKDETSQMYHVKLKNYSTLSHYMICCTLLHSACTYLHAVCCEDVRTVTLAPPWTLVALMAGLCDTSALVTEST